MQTMLAGDLKRETCWHHISPRRGAADCLRAWTPRGRRLVSAQGAQREPRGIWRAQSRHVLTLESPPGGKTGANIGRGKILGGGVRAPSRGRELSTALGAGCAADAGPRLSERLNLREGRLLTCVHDPAAIEDDDAAEGAEDAEE